MSEAMDALHWLEQLNALDEHERVEAKRGSEVGRAVMETVCAFSNEPGLQGGTLLLGVERDEDDFFLPWQITGVMQPDKLSADLTPSFPSITTAQQQRQNEAAKEHLQRNGVY